MPVRDGESIVGAVIRATDITEFKSVQEELVQVRRLLPMCAWCGRIQGENGAWESINSYLKRVGKTDVSHGLCPECEDTQLSRAEGA